MRKILFRGQSRRRGEKVHIATHEPIEGEWKYGGVLQGSCAHSIIYGYDNDDQIGSIQKHVVYTDTLGQYTGLKDRNGKRICENDIVEFDNCVRSARYLVWWNRETSMMTAVPLDGIYFNGTDYGNGKYPQFNYDTFCLMMQDPWGDFRDIKVIGNIHDSPELIEV